MKRFAYRHSRGMTEVVVGRDLPYSELVERPVLVIEEGLRPPIPGVPVLALKGGEGVKSFDTLLRIYEFLARAGVDRSTALVAVGGGALLDVATFAAGTYMRGLRLVSVPTTLLAMIDAALGGKGAVDVGSIKNLIGVFYQPSLIFCDTSWLDTLPDRAYRSAFAEMVKYGVALDEELYAWIKQGVDALLRREERALETAIFRSLQIKARVVEIDEFEERGIRQVLNVGHTVGHALERVLGLLHGEAVSLGIVAELHLSRDLGYLREDVVADVRSLLEVLGLPTRARASREQLAGALSLIKFDKKRRGEYIYMPLVVRLGRWVLERVRPEDVARATSYVVHVLH
jgi:3-dehydroquinate synthase